MRGISRPAAVLSLLAVLASAAGGIESGTPKRASVYDSPQMAFEAYVAAVQTKDGITAYEALTAESQDTLLFEQWAEELVGDSSPSALPTLLDEAKRRAATREAVPTRRSDLPALFTRSIKDRRAAFQAIVPSLFLLRHNTVAHFRIANVKLEGDKATADLFFKDEDSGPTDDPIRFVKDDQGWLVDLRTNEYHQPQPSASELEVANSEDVLQHYASPAEAFAAFDEGRRKLDAAKVWSTLSPRFRNDYLLAGRRQLLEEHGDNLILHWYGDINTFADADNSNPLPTEQEERAEEFAKVLYDPLLFLAAILKRQHELEQSRGRRVIAELGNIQIEGDRGQGTVTKHFEVDLGEAERVRTKKSQALTTNVYFQQSANGWLIDLPTREEQAKREQEWKASREGGNASSKTPRAQTYVSPEDVFNACRRARSEFDVQTLGECLTADSWDSLIFDAWAEQFHFMNDSPTLHEVLDERRRRELTWEKLPVMHEDLQPLLIGSLTDRSGALALALHLLKLDGELREVKVEGNKATAQLHQSKPAMVRITHSLATHRSFSFVKDDQGWQISLVTLPGEPGVAEPEEELDETERMARALKPRRPKPWTNQPPSKYSTPQDADQAQSEGFSANDPETIWNCLTEDRRRSFMQEKMLMLVETGGGDYVIGWYLDNAKLKEKRGPHNRKWNAARANLPEVKEDESEISPANEARERIDFQQDQAWQRRFEESIYDPKAYFSAIVKRLDLSNRKSRIRNPDLKPSKLKKVEIQGDRAVAVMNENGFFDFTAEFSKVNGSWLLDQENEEEHIISWKKQKEENRRSREMAEKERDKKPASEVQDQDDVK